MNNSNYNKKNNAEVCYEQQFPIIVENYKKLHVNGIAFKSNTIRTIHYCAYNYSELTSPNKLTGVSMNDSH